MCKGRIGHSHSHSPEGFAFEAVDGPGDVKATTRQIFARQFLLAFDLRLVLSLEYFLTVSLKCFYVTPSAAAYSVMQCYPNALSKTTQWLYEPVAPTPFPNEVYKSA